MEDPSEELVDRHFKLQLNWYEQCLKHKASSKDQANIQNWLSRFQGISREQKVARNSLMLLMYGHLTEFGCLQEPFTDVGNCENDLNRLVDDYKGLTEGKAKPEEVSSLPLKRTETYTRIPKDVKEQKWCNDNAISSWEIPVTNSYDSHECYNKITNVNPSVRERINIFEKAKEIKKPATKAAVTSSVSSWNINSNEKICDKEKLTVERPKVVRCLKYCFDEMADLIKTNNKDLSPAPKPSEIWRSRRTPSAVPPKRSSSTKIVPPEESPEIVISSSLDEQIISLKERNAKLRKQCLQYYNLDGSLKTTSPRHAPGFLINAQRALQRLKHWRGLPLRLSFLSTCYRFTGLGLSPAHWRAIDRKLEQVVHKWLHRKLRLKRRHAWRIYRQLILAQGPGIWSQGSRLLLEILDTRKDLILNRMSHLMQIKQLCVRKCSGKLRPLELQQLLGQLEGQYLKWARHLHCLACQQQQLPLSK